MRPMPVNPLLHMQQRRPLYCAAANVPEKSSILHHCMSSRGGHSAPLAQQWRRPLYSTTAHAAE